MNKIPIDLIEEAIGRVPLALEIVTVQGYSFRIKVVTSDYAYAYRVILN